MNSRDSLFSFAQKSVIIKKRGAFPVKRHEMRYMYESNST